MQRVGTPWLVWVQIIFSASLFLLVFFEFLPEKSFLLPLGSSGNLYKWRFYYNLVTSAYYPGVTPLQHVLFCLFGIRFLSCFCLSCLPSQRHYWLMSAWLGMAIHLYRGLCDLGPELVRITACLLSAQVNYSWVVGDSESVNKIIKSLTAVWFAFGIICKPFTYQVVLGFLIGQVMARVAIFSPNLLGIDLFNPP